MNKLPMIVMCFMLFGCESRDETRYRLYGLHHKKIDGIIFRCIDHQEYIQGAWLGEWKPIPNKKCDY